MDFGAGTKADQYRYSYITSGSQTTSTSSRLTVQEQSLAVSQQYQFFRNQWFHPHVGAGVDIARETTREQYHQSSSSTASPVCRRRFSRHEPRDRNIGSSPGRLPKPASRPT